MMTLMGWNQAQWDEVADKYLRITRMLPILHESIEDAMKGSAKGLTPYLDLQAWWRSKYDREPNGITRVKLDGGSEMGGQRVDFGFDCKVTTMGWREDPFRGGQVYELRVRVGNASFGCQQFVSMTKTMMARDDGFKRAVERRAIEELKREVVDKLFPNL